MRRVRGLRVMPGGVIEPGEVHCVVDVNGNEEWSIETYTWIVEEDDEWTYHRDATPPAPNLLAAERERIAQAIEASNQCSCRDSYCAQRSTAKRAADIARTPPP